MSKRTEILRKRLFDQNPKVCAERCAIFTKSMQETEGLPIAIRRAKGFADVLRKMTIYVAEDELIVGNMAKWPKASPIYPEYSVEWLYKELDGDPYPLDQRPGDKFWCDEDVKEEIISCLDYWKGKSIYESLRKILPKNVNDAWEANVIDDTWVSAAGIGNIVSDFELVVNKGLKYILEKIRKKLDSLDLREPDTVKKKWFLEAAEVGVQAVIDYAKRYAAECESQADACEDEKRKKELLDMAAVCRNVPENPARSFHEAVQSIYFILLTVHIESNGHSISLGRFDQYVGAFYEADIEAGKTTREQALEIIECMYIKCNEINKLRSWADSEFFLGYQMFINIAIGGQTADGEDAINEVSHLCIEACENVKLFTPSVSVKWFEKTPDDFMLKALEAALKHQGGQPAFYNDLSFINVLKNMGIPEKDRYNWVPNGCIEASIPGKWDFAAKGPWLNVEKVLDIALHDGTDPATGIHFYDPEVELKDCSCTDEFFEQYKKALKYFIDLQVICEHINDELHIERDINAFRSALVDDCIDRGLDMVEGGALYSADGGPTAGSISAGDSLAALDYLVYEKKILTIEQLMHALDTNFEDESTDPAGEEVRAMLLNKAPKYGNDDDRADKWVVAVEDFIGRTYRYGCKSSKLGKGPIPACFSYSQSPVSGNVAFGRSIGATPDGRKKGSPVNNGISPANGSEKEGITAACNSVGKLPSVWFQKGAIFNVRLSKNVVDTKENRQKLIDTIKVLFGKKAQQIQFNVVSTEIYKDAMAHPENYKDLMVRVSGYSALFTSLAPDCQMDVINRAELDF